MDWCAENQLPDSLGDSGDDVLYNTFDRAFLHSAVWPRTPSPAFNSRGYSWVLPQLALVLILNYVNIQLKMSKLPSKESSFNMVYH